MLTIQKLLQNSAQFALNCFSNSEPVSKDADTCGAPQIVATMRHFYSNVIVGKQFDGHKYNEFNEPPAHGFNTVVKVTERLHWDEYLFVLPLDFQVFLHSITAKKVQSQLRVRDLEWWMRHRQLPVLLRQRVRQYERQNWAATCGINEEATIQNLPEGLRRDIKRHLCLNLVRQVIWSSFPNLLFSHVKCKCRT